MPTVKGVLQKYHEGQNIFRREAVSCLVARIEQLEKYIASQQSVHLTAFGDQPSESIPLQIPMFADDLSAINGGR